MTPRCGTICCPHSIAAKMGEYKRDDRPDSELRKAVLKARAHMYAISTDQGSAPAELKVEADKIRAELKNVDLKKMNDIMRNGIPMPGNEGQFKNEIAEREPRNCLRSWANSRRSTMI